MKKVVIVDIGSTKIVTIIAEKSEEGKINIVGSSVVEPEGIINGEIKEYQKAYHSIEKSLKEAEENYRKNNNSFTNKDLIKKVYVGIAGSHIATDILSQEIEIKDGKVTEQTIEELNQKVKNTIISNTYEIIHFIPTQYIVDDDEPIENPLGNQGNKLKGNFLVISGAKKSINMLKDIFENLGIEILKIFLEPYAAAFAVLDEAQKKDGVALIDLGGGTTDIILIKNNKLILAETIPFAGKIITKDISTILKINPSLAEELKIKYGSAISITAPDKIIELNNGQKLKATEFSKIIEARILEIVDTVKKIIDSKEYLNSLYSDFVLTGGTSLLKDLDKVFTYRFSKNFIVKKPNIENIKNAQIFDSPRFSTSIGLILAAFDIESKFTQSSNKPYNIKQEETQIPPEQDPEPEPEKEQAPKKQNIFQKSLNIIKNLFSDTSSEI